MINSGPPANSPYYMQIPLDDEDTAVSTTERNKKIPDPLAAHMGEQGKIGI